MINVTKSQPAPACLDTEKIKVSGDYKCGDVVSTIKNDFHNKCYLCEESEISGINVEHFRPHRGDVNLKFDWNNLFYACPHCNNTKSDRYDDILDCTDPSIKIVDIIRFKMVPLPKEKPEITAIEMDATTQNTVSLLNEIYIGHTNIKENEAINICDKLCKEMWSFTKILYKYYYEPGLTESDKDRLKKKISRKLSAESPFTAFKIWVIKDNPIYTKDFASYL